MIGLLTALLLLSFGATTQSQAVLDRMAEAKAETDLGNYEAAIKVLSALVEDDDATPALRAEGLVRLGVARRGAGDLEGALKSFERASKAPGLDGDTKALLVQALGGALPSGERWSDVWPRVGFTVDRSDPKRPTLAIVWPHLPAKQAYTGQPISLDFKDADLGKIFRLIADVTDLNVVVAPGVRGKATFKADNEPWDKCLDRILAANGLGYQLDDNVLWIAPMRQLRPLRRYSGQPIDIDDRDRDVRETFAQLAAAGGVTVAIDPAIRGRSTLRLKQVRWDRVFDMVVRLHGLDWKREGDTLKVFPRKKAAESR